MADDATWLDTMPEIYDRCLGPVLFRPYAQHLARRAAASAPRDVLELAAGTGIVTRELLRQLPGAAVTATDLNPAMVSWGAAHAPGATWLAADAQHLDFADATFDLVVCQFGVMFFPDRPACLRRGGTGPAPGRIVALRHLGHDGVLWRSPRPCSTRCADCSRTTRRTSSTGCRTAITTRMSCAATWSPRGSQ